MVRSELLLTAPSRVRVCVGAHTIQAKFHQQDDFIISCVSVRMSEIMCVVNIVFRVAVRLKHLENQTLAIQEIKLGLCSQVLPQHTAIKGQEKVEKVQFY